MTMRVGSRGENVKTLQTQLNELSYDPGPADGIFGRRTRGALAAFQTAYLVDGIADSVTIDALAAASKAWSQKDVSLIFPRPHGKAELEGAFGKIEFVDAGAGSIEITNDWDDKHIARVNLPIVGSHLVHKRMESVFRAVLKNLKDKGLDDEITQFGVWCPRHKMHNPARSLSTHSWAISCDINWATNPVGRIGDLHPGIVDSFERFGFQWGGRWKTRDDMHFQYCTGF